MPSIKFSHLYHKLLSDLGEPIKTATLLQVLPIELEKLTKPFIEYDTDNGKYQLPYHGVYIILLFQKHASDGGDLFTTVRPQFTRFGNTQKYYESLCGFEFNIIIN